MARPRIDFHPSLIGRVGCRSGKCRHVWRVGREVLVRLWIYAWRLEAHHTASRISRSSGPTAPRTCVAVASAPRLDYANNSSSSTVNMTTRGELQNLYLLVAAGATA